MMATVNTLNTMGYVAQSLRGTVVPMQVAIHQAKQVIQLLEGTIQPDVAAKLSKLGALTVDISLALRGQGQPQAAYHDAISGKQEKISVLFTLNRLPVACKLLDDFSTPTNGRAVV